MFGKKAFLTGAVFFLFVVLGCTFSLKVNASAYDNAYKSIVKIHTYYEDSNNYLRLASTGSGVTITGSGIILTNSHVVTVKDAFNENKKTVFKVCVTQEDFTQEPVCNYTASLIADDEDNDIALLKMIPISSQTTLFSTYLERSINPYQNGDSVIALGYPGSGGSTITGATGTVLGAIEMNGLSWIKTDALVSFGSSGGALINSFGKVIGITTRANSDLGYVIDINDINKWIDLNLNKPSKIDNSLNERMKNFVLKQNNLSISNKFVNKVPSIEFTKVIDWKFVSTSENYVLAYNSQNEKGGAFVATWIPYGKKITQNLLDVIVKNIELQGDCFSVGNINLGDRIGRKIICSSDGEELTKIYFPSDNYIITLYHTATLDNDKEVISNIMSTLKIEDSNELFVEQKIYEHSSPYFKLDLSNDWVLKELNTVDWPVYGDKLSVPEISFDVLIFNPTENVMKMSNEAYFNFIKDDEYIKESNENDYGYTAERYFKSVDYKINDELNHEIFYKYRFKDEDDNNEVKFFSAGYRIRDISKVFVIELFYLGTDEVLFEKYLNDFQINVLSNLTLGRKIEQIDDSVTTPIVTLGKVVLENKEIKNIGKKLIGNVLLQVESNGEAWYLSPKDNQACYLGRPEDAFGIMREQGVGITNKDLEKIPVGFVEGKIIDTDGDGLSDLIETAFGTNKNKVDTDGDGFNDKEEILGNYNPNGSGAMGLDISFANKNKGKIFLQAESKGEAWYINPKDGKRYFLGRPEDAFNVMRFLGLGVSDKDFNDL